MSWSWSYGNWIYNYLCNQYLSPLKLWVRTPFVYSIQTLCDKVCQWLAAGRWLSPCTPVSSTNKTDRHDINEILLKVALNTMNLNRLSYEHWHINFSVLYHLRYLYLGTVNQIVMTTVKCLNRWLQPRSFCLRSFSVGSWALSRKLLYCA